MNLSEAKAALKAMIEQRLLMSDDPYVVTDKLRDMDREIDALQDKILELEAAENTDSAERRDPT